MEIWTRYENQPEWSSWPDPALALASLLDDPIAQVLLLTDAPDVECATLVGVLRIVHVLTAHAICIVASPHPAAAWVAALRPLGVAHFWTVNRKAARHTDGLGEVSEVRDSICLGLHTVTEGGTTLSVCGCHHDRIVLGRNHLERWCLKSDPSCPHRR